MRNVYGELFIIAEQSFKLNSEFIIPHSITTAYPLIH